MTAVYTNNQDRVIAYGRGQGDQQFVVVTNLANNDRSGYGVNLPPGQWKEVLNTNGREYGGTGTGNFGAVVSGNHGLNLPAGSSIVLRRKSASKGLVRRAAENTLVEKDSEVEHSIEYQERQSRETGGRGRKARRREQDGGYRQGPARTQGTTGGRAWRILGWARGKNFWRRKFGR